MQQYYHTGQCHNISEFCSIDGLQYVNATHCLSADAQAIKAEKAVKRVSAAEDFYR